MTFPQRNSRLAFALVALSVAGCGGGTTTGAGTGDALVVVSARPAWERAPLLLLPRDAFLVAHVDGAQVRRSPYFPFLETTLRAQLHEGSDPEGQTLGALLSGTDDVWLGVREAPGPDDVEFVAVLRGAGVEQGMRRLLAEDPPSGAHERKAHAEIWRDGTDNAYVRLDAKTWVVAVGGALDGLLARVEGTAQGDPLSESRLRAIADRVGLSSGAPVAVASRLPPSVRRMLAGESFPLTLLADAEYAGGRLDASNGLVVALTADMTSPDAAARADDALRGVVSSYASNPMVALMGLSDILRRIDVRATGARVDVRASTTDEETRSLLQRYGELISSALAARDAPVDEASPRSAAR
jgi:hypothetical protein